MSRVAPRLGQHPLAVAPRPEDRQGGGDRRRRAPRPEGRETDAGQGENGRVQAVEVAQLVRAGAPREPEGAGRAPPPSPGAAARAATGPADDGDEEARREQDDEGGRQEGPLLPVHDEGHLQAREAPQRVAEVEEPLPPQPPGAEGGHRARRRDHLRARRADRPRDEERRGAEGQARGEGERSWRASAAGPRARAPAPSRRRRGSRARSSRRRGRRRGRGRRRARAPGTAARGRPVARQRGQGGDEREAGDERHEEVRRRARGGHQRHVRRAPRGEERPRPARGRAAEAAGQQDDEHDEERGAQELVEAVGGVVRERGQQRRQQVGVEGAVVGLVPEGRRELAPEHVAAHQEEDRVVVRDRQVERRPVERPSRRREGGHEREDGQEAARGRAHGRKCTLDKHGPPGVVLTRGQAMTRSIEAMVDEQARRWQLVRGERRQEERPAGRDGLAPARGRGRRGREGGWPRISGSTSSTARSSSRIADSAHLSERVVSSLDEKDRELLTDWLAALSSRSYLSPSSTATTSRGWWARSRTTAAR